MEIRRIAILTLGARAAHMRAAQAIHQALHDGADNVEARTIDALDRAQPWFVRLCALSHGSMARSTPAVAPALGMAAAETAPENLPGLDFSACLPSGAFPPPVIPAASGDRGGPRFGSACGARPARGLV